MVMARIKIIFIFIVSFLGLVFLMLYNIKPLPIPEPEIYFEAGEVSDISAKAWLIFDPSTKKVFASENADTVLPIASVVKLMTALVYVDRGDLSATHTIAYNDVLTEGRAGKLQAGQTYTGRELLYPLLLESSNDAATTLLRYQTDLLEQMNQTAKDINLPDTFFADPSGLSARSVSTAKDIASLMSYLYKDRPYVLDVSRLPEFYTENNGWMNTSPFYADHAYRGGKHGFIYEANRTVGALFEEILPNEQKYTFGYVLLGSDDLVSDMKILREYTRTQARYE
jgi:D-alanyl-D-alanine carboxypeptidase